MKHILITVGPIPAKLDSVKFVTNRFKGGLAIRTAEMLVKKGNTVTIVAWKHSGINIPATQAVQTIFVDDVMDYYNTVLKFEADAYVLAAAVANLMPSSPYIGKFPSHNYKVGDKFPIEFEIAPRVIDDIKKHHPRSTLIGYKLFDGSDEEIIRAATITLHESKANLVFANHPAWAKTRKIALTQDAAIFECSFDDHIDLIHRLVHAEFYSTQLDTTQMLSWSAQDSTIMNTYPKYPKDGRVYGTFAIRKDGHFLTTTRGKSDSGVTAVFNVDHEKRIIIARDKATLNAPLLDALLKRNPHINILIHGHDLIGDDVHDAYEFPGTDGDLTFAVTNLRPKHPILLNHHGFMVGFENFNQYRDWMESTGQFID